MQVKTAVPCEQQRATNRLASMRIVTAPAAISNYNLLESQQALLDKLNLNYQDELQWIRHCNLRYAAVFRIKRGLPSRNSNSSGQTCTLVVVGTTVSTAADQCASEQQC
eukprot:6201693-Pleurochrysis_carterae.AAC.6